MMEEGASDFEVSDRRSSVAAVKNADVQNVTDTASASAGDERRDVGAAAAEEEKPSTGGGLPDPYTLLTFAAVQTDTAELMTLLIPLFDNLARVSLGLLASPKTGETDVNLAEAKLAIDAVHFLLEAVGSRLSDADRRELQRRLSDLRMNYVARS